MSILLVVIVQKLFASIWVLAEIHGLRDSHGIPLPVVTNEQTAILFLFRMLHMRQKTIPELDAASDGSLYGDAIIDWRVMNSRAQRFERATSGERDHVDIVEDPLGLAGGAVKKSVIFDLFCTTRMALQRATSSESVALRFLSSDESRVSMTHSFGHKTEFNV